MYTQSERVAGLRAEGVHIRQTTGGYGKTVMCHSHSLWYVEQLMLVLQVYN